MRPKIIAVDFDGTLYRDGKLNGALMSQLKAEQARGAYVILWTCRDGDGLREAVTMLRERGFAPNNVNANCPAAVKMLKRDPRKVFADVYIDDKNMTMRV